MQLNPELSPIPQSQVSQAIWTAAVKPFGNNKWTLWRGYDTKEALVDLLELSKDWVEEYYIYKLTLPIAHIH